jgi:spore germination cell wall hydrolase CwlJ-like protein
MIRLVPDWKWAVMTIMQEAQGEPYSTKLAVAEVIIRRTKMKYNSDGTVAGTVLWPMQFSGWNAKDDTPKYRERVECAKVMEDDPVVMECIKAWKEAENGSNTTGRATLYYNPSISNPPWAKTCIETAVIDKHRYMREE